MSICALFGIERDPAFAMALLVHVMILAVTSIGGIVAYVALRHRVPPVVEAAVAPAGHGSAHPVPH